METPLISICIPAYMRVNYLKRLLDSIAIQTFTNFEIVITDDSTDHSVYDLIHQFYAHLPIAYYKNASSLGTPENWNEALRKARGTWIKLMHDDDWFSNSSALYNFYNAIVAHPDCSFFFSAFENRDIDKGKREIVRCNRFHLWMLQRNPLHLFKKVYVGNPSCTLIKKDIDLWYDNRYKFVVDFEYYIRYIKKVKNWNYIDEVLLNIGFHDTQVTKYTFKVAAVQIPENHLLLREMGVSILHNYFVYDYYWRMYRNLNIRRLTELEKYDTMPIDKSLKQMILFQQKIPIQLLKIGLISKCCMTFNYLRNLLSRNFISKSN